MNPYVDKRYSITDKRTHLEIIPTPDLFLASDFNTNTELILEFLDTFFKETFGAVRKSGYEVGLVGNDVTITSGDIWWGKFLARTTVSTTLINGRTASTVQYVYLKIVLDRKTIADDLVSESNVENVFIRQNVNGTDLSRPNQYIYEHSLEIHSTLQTDSLGNLPDNEDTYYVRLATIAVDDTITYDIRTFGEVLSSEDLDYENIPTNLTQALADIIELFARDANNAKKNADNVFVSNNAYSPTESTYDSGNKEITLGATNINHIEVAGTLVVESLSSKPVGTVMKLKLNGSGNIVFKNSSNLICPGGKDLAVAFSNWVEFITRSSGVWEITSNSTANTALISSQGGVPVGSIVAYEGTLEEFDGTGLGFGSMTGWAICNGNNNTGDARGRNLVGLSTGDGDFNALSATGGSKTAKIEIANMPPHSFSGTTSHEPDHTHQYFAALLNDSQDGNGSGRAGNNYDGETEPAGGHSHTFTTNTLGEGELLSILNPFYVIVWIKRLS